MATIIHGNLDRIPSKNEVSVTDVDIPVMGLMDFSA
jgi:hypothetical protein